MKTEVDSVLKPVGIAIEFNGRKTVFALSSHDYSENLSFIYHFSN
jgi:hypothetical protein